MPTYSGNINFTTTTSTTATSDSVWSNWLVTGWDMGTTASRSVWTSWSNDTYRAVQPYRPVVSPETPEQRAEREANYERQRVHLEEQRRLRVAEEEEARRKAVILLEENLSPEQLQQFKDNKWFEVITAKGRFRIRTGWAGNVDRVDDAGKAIDRYCIHPSEQVPHEDNMLAQKLLLEADVDAFIRIANRSPVYA